MNTLIDSLEQKEQSRIAAISPAGTFRLEELLSRAWVLRRSGKAEEIRAARATDGIEEFLVTLAASEGWLEELFLEPARSEAAYDAHALRQGPRRLLEARRTQLVVATSGTTGKPKLVAHTLDSLTATTKRTRAGGEYRWGLLYDPARFAGLQVVLQALLGGAVLVTPSLDNLDSAADFMAVHGVTALSATPSHWRKLLMTRSIGRLPLRQITLGGEIVDGRILESLRLRFPGCRITHIYASTEAGVGFSVRDGAPGFPAAYLHDGTLRGVQIRVRQDGRLLVRKNRPEQRAAGVSEVPIGNDDFVDTGDLVEIRGDRVYFLGRASGTINVAGNHVIPESVESVLCGHPDVVAARVFGKPSSITGSLVAAEVQIRQPSAAAEIKRRLNDWCRERLARHQRPASLSIVDEMGIAGSGKIERRAAGDG